MSLKPTIDYVVPAQTARIAKAAFPKGALCLQLYDHLGKIFQDQDFIDLFPRRGQPATAPFRLALVTLLQYVEGLSDRGAANAVRSRLDWKYRELPVGVILLANSNRLIFNDFKITPTLFNEGVSR